MVGAETAANPNSKLRAVVIWLAFSVVFALSPLFVNFLLVRDKPNFDWTELYNRGELFLVSAVLCADAVGRMWGQRAEAGYLVTFCLIGCFFILFASSVEFGMFARTLDAGGRLGALEVHDSAVAFGATVLAGLGAVLAEE